MLRADTFWGYEKEAPLLKLNRGYLQAQGEPLFARVGSWLPMAGVNAHDAVVLVDVANPDRIFVADAERTFRNDANRARFVQLLAHLAGKFGDYAQGMSYVASFLSLTLSESEVFIFFFGCFDHPFVYTSNVGGSSPHTTQQQREIRSRVLET